MRMLQNQSGSALLFAVLMLSLLTIIGLSAASNTTLELMIAGNEKAHKQAFYYADGADDLAEVLLEQAISARGWSDRPGAEIRHGKVRLIDKNFYLAAALGTAQADVENRDAIIDFGRGVTSLVVGSSTLLSSGGAAQMLSGYEGQGKSAAAGGAWIVYDIRTQHESPAGSKVKIASQWRHLL